MSIRALALEAILRRVMPSTEVDVDTEMERRRRDGGPLPAVLPQAVRKRWRVERSVTRGHRVLTLRHTKPASHSVIFLAGGGYSHPISTAHWKAAARIAALSEMDVVVPMYEVAPKGDARRAHAFVGEVLHLELARRGEGGVHLVGDSAGGGLALSVLQQRPGGVAGAVLLSPWVDVEMRNPASGVLERCDVILKVAELRAWGLAWAGELSPADPLLSPINGSLGGLPPVHVITGGRDLLMPDALELYRRLKDAGNQGTLTYEPDGNHALGIMGKATPESARALGALIASLRA